MMDDIAHAKNEVISKIYHDPGGHGSIKETFQDAKKKDNTITLFDVKNGLRATHKESKTWQGLIHMLPLNHFLNIKLICFLLVIGTLQKK